MILKQNKKIVNSNKKDKNQLQLCIFTKKKFLIFNNLYDLLNFLQLPGIFHAYLKSDGRYPGVVSHFKVSEVS